MLYLLTLLMPLTSCLVNYCARSLWWLYWSFNTRNL